MKTLGLMFLVAIIAVVATLGAIRWWPAGPADPAIQQLTKGGCGRSGGTVVESGLGGWWFCCYPSGGLAGCWSCNGEIGGAFDNVAVNCTAERTAGEGDRDVSTAAVLITIIAMRRRMTSDTRE